MCACVCVCFPLKADVCSLVTRLARSMLTKKHTHARTHAHAKHTHLQQGQQEADVSGAGHVELKQLVVGAEVDRPWHEERKRCPAGPQDRPPDLEQT